MHLHNRRSSRLEKLCRAEEYGTLLLEEDPSGAELDEEGAGGRFRGRGELVSPGNRPANRDQGAPGLDSERTVQGLDASRKAPGPGGGKERRYEPILSSRGGLIRGGIVVLWYVGGGACQDLRQDPGSQARSALEQVELQLGRVHLLGNGQDLLNQDGAGVQAIIHQVDCHASVALAVPEDPERWVRAPAVGQRRRMHVQDAKLGNCPGAGWKAPRVAGGNDEVWLKLLQETPCCPWRRRSIPRWDSRL